MYRRRGKWDPWSYYLLSAKCLRVKLQRNSLFSLLFHAKNPRFVTDASIVHLFILFRPQPHFQPIWPPHSFAYCSWYKIGSPGLSSLTHERQWNTKLTLEWMSELGLFFCFCEKHAKHNNLYLYFQVMLVFKCRPHYIVLKKRLKLEMSSDKMLF